MTNQKLNKDIKSIEEILFISQLKIPFYQRPYKWQEKNVNQLIDDILTHNDKTAYRIGTIVLHKENSQLNIVDGQQRLFTLSLLAYELLQTDAGKQIIKINANQLALSKTQLDNNISIKNLKKNHLLIQSRINEFNRDDILFFFKKCEVVYIELDDISEAFQFFDSQNTRGRDLAPHDLLKAYHLRKMLNNTEIERINCVTKWEEVSDVLHDYFQNYLFKVRQWSKGRSGLYFSKNNVDVFKGVTLENAENYNFIQSYRIIHFFTEKYNADLNRKIDLTERPYPFQIDMIMIDGKRFFEYVHYYATYIQKIEATYDVKKSFETSGLLNQLKDDSYNAKEIFRVLRSYESKNRIGDLYVRNLMDCCILYYIDKFGIHKLDEAIVKFFLWSFKLRLERQAVQEVTIDNHARDYSSFLKLIRESVHSNDIVHQVVKPVNYVGDSKAVKNIGAIKSIFESLKAIKNHD